MQPNESLRSNSTPDARYEVSPEAKQWAEETFATLHSGDVSLGYDEWLRLDRERQHKMEGDSECKLAWLRRESPGGSSEIEDLEEELLRERKKKAADEIERQQEKMESKIPKNLLTHYEDTLRAMSYLEGEGWLLGEAEGQTAASARKQLSLGVKERWEKAPTLYIRCSRIQSIFCLFRRVRTLLLTCQRRIPNAPRLGFSISVIDSPDCQPGSYKYLYRVYY